MKSIAALAPVAALFAAGAAAAQAPVPQAPATQAPAAQAPDRAANPLHQAVAAYGAFQADVTLLRASPMGSAADLDRVLDRAAEQNRTVLARGITAYGALTAAQSPAFAQGVRDAAAFFGRDRLIRAMAADTRYARLLAGADEATTLALDALAADGARVQAVANRFTSMSRSMQRTAWVAAVAPQQPQRLNRLRALAAGAGVRAVPNGPNLAVAAASTSPAANPAAFGGRQFWDGAAGAVPPGTVTVATPAAAPSWRPHPELTAVIDRMATLGAIHILDVGPNETAIIDQLLNDPITEHCLHLKQLEFYNSIQAARFRYENMYGLGETVSGVSRCIASVAQPVFPAAPRITP